MRSLKLLPTQYVVFQLIPDRNQVCCRCGAEEVPTFSLKLGTYLDEKHEIEINAPLTVGQFCTSCLKEALDVIPLDG